MISSLFNVASKLFVTFYLNNKKIVDKETITIPTEIQLTVYMQKIKKK